MSVARLAQRAARDARRAERVASWRLTDHWASFACYLYWRNRFPILAKLLSRAALFLEIFLLYRFFHLYLAASLAFVIFGLFIIKNAFRGVSQYFRLAIAAADQRGDRNSIGRLTYGLIASAIAVGAAAAAAMNGAAWLFDAPPTPRALLGASLLMLPLDYAASAFWMILYTQHRQRRSFLVQAACRLLPAGTLLLGHRIMGPYAYVLGIAAGRCLESIYLIKIAQRELAASDIVPKRPKHLRRFFGNVLRDRLFWQRSFAPIPYAAYCLSLAAVLWLRSPNMWLTHLVFYFLLISAAYPALRASESLGMDIFLALRAGDLNLAQRFAARARQAAICIVGLIIVGLCVLFAAQTALFTIQGDVLYSLWLFFLAELAALTLYQTEMNLNRSAGTEHFFNGWTAGVLLCGMIPLQAVLLLYYRANLPFMYLIDSLCFFALTATFAQRSFFEHSPLFAAALSRRLQSLRLLPPALWISYFAAWRRGGSSYGLLIVQLSDRYLTALKNPLLNALGRELPPGCGGCEIVNGLLLVVAPGCNAAHCERLCQTLQRKFGGHLRNVLAVDLGLPLLSNLTAIRTACSKVRTPGKAIRSLEAALGDVLRDDSLRQLAARRDLQSFASFSRQQGIICLKQLCADHGFSKLPAVYLTGDRRQSRGRVSPDLQRFAARVAASPHGLAVMAPPLIGQFAVFSIGGTPLMVLDAASVSQRERLRLFHLSLNANLLLSIKLAAELTAAETVPFGLYEIFRDTLRGAADVQSIELQEWEVGKTLQDGCLLMTATQKGRKGLYLCSAAA